MGLPLAPRVVLSAAGATRPMFEVISPLPRSRKLLITIGIFRKSNFFFHRLVFPF